ncbi:hypothetical protein [Alkalihalobacillus pseudalcaliphilus]|uniref:hypothetical protein n=1 Tax=Alkalihalobacillus pseudalcaliphilus TaxID=79884 RepID=UPI000ACAD2D8|nr:hypothetical protein [Alkalihalobacillus pseudalcaliphilus]
MAKKATDLPEKFADFWMPHYQKPNTEHPSSANETYEHSSWHQVKAAIKKQAELKWKDS